MKHKLFALLLMLTCSVQADETNLRNGIQAYRAEHYDTATQHFTAAVFAATNDTERARALHGILQCLPRTGGGTCVQLDFTPKTRIAHAA